MNKRSQLILLSCTTSSLFFCGTSIVNAASFTVNAANNSFGGSGVGLDTGINFNAGESLIISVDQNDLWSAGSLPRWSNADGLVTNLFATGTDESGEAPGTLIGRNFGSVELDGFSAPFGSLVGEIGETLFLAGTNFNGVAPDSGNLIFYYWDSNSIDNSESVEVNVVINPVTPPPVTTPESNNILGILVFTGLCSTVTKQLKK